MTLRNRELLNLFAVGLLTTIGFAAVYIASQDVPEFDTTSLTYAAFFLALFVAAHIVLRITLPLADPYLLPIGGLLTAIGLTMIYRIKPDLAFRQGVWVVIGVGFFVTAHDRQIGSPLASSSHVRLRCASRRRSKFFDIHASRIDFIGAGAPATTGPPSTSRVKPWQHGIV